MDSVCIGKEGKKVSVKKKRRLLMRTVILIVLFAAVGFTLYASLTKDKSPIVVGEKAPDFVLTDLEGNKHQLSDYKGKGVFINFWGTWCEPCKVEMPHINTQYNEYKSQGVEVLAVNMGEPTLLINNFLDKYDFTFPVLEDKSKDVAGLYNIYKLPATIIVDSDGVIVDIVEGQLPEGRIKAMMEQIKPE
ncbi:thiol-disulfide oxidoreductase [Virgibacillus soli]|uniref:Thiol-disulfide oxidoreductase n=1 Tax=Lederbergia galactosidilytica TaxID=217031 RepID=A0A0Q9XV12_9BACI|nr:thiol-disulfide oxidoreductase ResA [Lederbergia galactosidilytica]KRG12198.1 thiol-disulfide oxidoreductase [Lederbergia galactosidilytica]KRG12747.1 thiol-disulfide oxidoreductase [Virgibacillus soli]OAK75260.1 thiol-disulfide oxidoreductase [Lederbergia galactosidilytica]